MERHRIELNRPLLLLKEARGLLACGYLSLEALERQGDAAAIVRGVETFEDMLRAEVREATRAAAALGVRPGMRGAEALERFR